MQETPILILEASRQPYLSIARHTGAIRYNGSEYLYIPPRDALLRKDWVKVYQSLPYDDFLAAVRTGTKPDLKALRQQKKREQPPMPNLFADEP